MTEFTPEALIEALQLTPLGFEGGFYRETYRSNRQMNFGAPYSGERSVWTSIYYLLTPHTQSLMHRLRTDEVYHFYLGDPVEMLLMDPRDAQVTEPVLGPDVFAGQRVQLRVPEGVWQGGRLRKGGAFALMGTTMAPGFDLQDFELGHFEALRRRFPQWEAGLRRLTPTVVTTPEYELRAAGLDLLHAERQRAYPSLEDGLGAQLDPQWPPPGHGPEILDACIEARSRPGPRDLGVWYIVRRRDRRVVGVGHFTKASEPEPPQVRWVEPCDDTSSVVDALLGFAAELRRSSTAASTRAKQEHES